MSNDFLNTREKCRVYFLTRNECRPSGQYYQRLAATTCSALNAGSPRMLYPEALFLHLMGHMVIFLYYYSI